MAVTEAASLRWHHAWLAFDNDTANGHHAGFADRDRGFP